MGIGLIVVGILPLILGALLLYRGIPNLRRRARILQTPTLLIAQAPGNGPVEVKGRIVPSDQGLVLAPFSGRQAVWVHVLVQEWRTRGRSAYWKTVISEFDHRPFMVDDGSGQTARVLPKAATVVLEGQSVVNSGTFQDAPPQLEAFIRSRGLQSTGVFGLNKRMRYEEQVLLPGDNLFALGPSRREPSGELVLYKESKEPKGELILTNKTEAQLVSKMLRVFLIGAIMGGLGALLTVAGVVVQVFELGD